MGTGNFMTYEANRVYAVLMPYEVEKKTCDGCGLEIKDWQEDLTQFHACPECGEEMEDGSEYEYPEDHDREYLLDAVEERMETLTKETPFYYCREEGRWWDSSRSFPASKIGSLTHEIIFSDMGNGVASICLEIEMVLVGGYYEGANLDYRVGDIEVVGSKCDPEDEDDLWREIMEYLNQDETENPEQVARETIKKMNTALDDMVNILEKTYSLVAMPLKMIGRASNGETFYERVEEPA